MGNRYRFRMNTANSYTAYATQFAGDGQCWLERDAGLTGAADGTRFAFSTWVNFTGGDGVAQHLLSPNNTRCKIEKRTSNLLRITAINTAAATVAQIDQNSGAVAAITAATGWVHIACSVANLSSGGYAQLYINRVSCGTLTTFLANDTSIDFTDSDWGVGGYIGGATYLTGALCEYYFNSAESIDFSSSANLDKFNLASKPVSLGSTGATPTGTQPIVYLRTDYTSFTTNSGSGGNFVKKGTTALASATPP